MYTKSVFVCVSATSTRADWSLSEFQFAMPNNHIEILLIHSEIFSTEKDSGILLSLLTEMKDRAGSYRYAHLPYADKKEESE